MPSTIRDVARAAGVSVATVSRVFNDSGPVREATRRAVVEAAQRLEYSPNSAARSLSLRRTHAVGVILPELQGYFFTEVIRGIDQVVQQTGCHLMISSPVESDLGGVLRGLRGRVDGLLLMVPEVGARVAELAARVPVVLLSSPHDGSLHDCLSIDDYGGAYRMLSHLLGLGHRRIALITGSPHIHGARERLRAWRDALTAHDVAVDEQLILPGDCTESSGYTAVSRLFERGTLPDAIFALNDAMATGALRALRERGVDVPGTVALAGFDDMPTAALLDPPLTTVRVDVAGLGARAARRLCLLMGNRNGWQPRAEVLPVELVVRASCGARQLQETR